MRIGIDATNIGGGGGITHLKEILFYLNDIISDDKPLTLIVFGSENVLKELPESNHVEKITFSWLNKKIYHRIIFQVFYFDKEIKKRCDILFSITGDYTGSFRPIISMSQNMLLYERKIWKEIKQPREIFRFWLIYQKQKRSFRNAAGIIFISIYACEEVLKQFNLEEKAKTIIHHGISPRFQGPVKKQLLVSEFSFENPFRFLYVSTVHVYKHQWNLVQSVANLRTKGYPISLDLVGGIIYKPAGRRLTETIQNFDPEGNFIHYHGHVPYNGIEKFYKDANGIVYASTCENMPNILIESMASGVPIACSNKQPMPEFLKENGYYFDAKNICSIENALEQLLLNPERREQMAKNNLKEVKKFSWKKTTEQTFNFIERIYNEYNHV